ncbi:hypothetical protein BaRGS_00020381 [Batillaria attramentaria]|uniref:Amidase domain-containing protein n=1 Tax=Batillaria attramentaria TaxID=370345 RepID=A0ABD0KMR8_9CAEN
MEGKGLYRAPALSGPQLEDFRRLNEELSFRCSEEELQGMAKIMEGVTAAYQRVSEFPDTSLPVVRYPRTPGYRPGPDDNPYNAWAWRCDIRGAAEGKLSGRTVGIKDNTAVAGVPMRCGSKILENYVPEFDATVVTRILDAGGHIVGKTSLEDMCISGSSVTSSDGPVRNPTDETRSAGGSSSGSAALVAAGLVDFAVGGDQGGSIRIPASFTGIVGLKPTYGLVPYTGAWAGEPTVDHLGPMARTVADCALLLEVMAGYDDGRDPRQYPGITPPEYSKLINNDTSGKKVGMLQEGFEVCKEDSVPRIVRGVLNTMSKAGLSVSELSIPLHKDGCAIWTASAGQAVYHCMLNDGGVGYYSKGFYPMSLQETTRRGVTSRPHDIPPLVKCFSLYGEYMTQLYGHGNKFYAKANNLVMELTRQYDAALQKFDVIVMPTLPYVAQKLPAAGCSMYGACSTSRSYNYAEPQKKRKRWVHSIYSCF